MAAGDVYSPAIATITSGNFDMQPAAGVEVVIHNIAHSASANLIFTDGTNSIVIDTQTGAGSWASMFLHCTNTRFYRVTSVGSVSNIVGCDGMTTK